jgi:preprotein translocase subunit SecD
VDSNVSTVLTALFLLQFGTGPVKGFAVTLILGIVASMITAVFVTRTFYMIWLQRRPDLTTLSI